MASTSACVSFAAVAVAVPLDSCCMLAAQGIPEAPTFYPTAEEFTDPLAFIEKIKPEGERSAKFVTLFASRRLCYGIQ